MKHKPFTPGTRRCKRSKGWAGMSGLGNDNSQITLPGWTGIQADLQGEGPKGITLRPLGMVAGILGAVTVSMISGGRKDSFGANALQAVGGFAGGVIAFNVFAEGRERGW